MNTVDGCQREFSQECFSNQNEVKLDGFGLVTHNASALVGAMSSPMKYDNEAKGNICHFCLTQPKFLLQSNKVNI